MAMAIVEHCSLLACDHLDMACKAAFSDSVAATNFHMHCTKCTQMINGVLAPYFMKMITSYVGDKKFSLLLDESTDVSVSKYLGVVIRYFSAKKRTLVSTFLGLAELEAGDAKSIATAIVEFLEKCNLKKENLQGIGTDNASVMTGVHNGVHKILKEECSLPNLILICCVCHFFFYNWLSVQHPKTRVEYLIRDNNNWF